MRDVRHIAVVGVTGYTGFELAKILLRHPAVEKPVFYVRDTNGAKCLSELFPQLRGWGEAPLRPFSLDAITASKAATAFLATPHEVSAEMAPALLETEMRVVDSEAVYGLPELYPEKIAGARLLANPGCYATSVILALRPLVDANLLHADSSVICDCKSGASGAGKDPRRDLHFVELDENFKAYSLFSHRHTPEILDHTGLREEKVVFSTHLLPVARGILSTIYVTLDSPQSPEAVELLYRKFYAGRPMMRVSSAGTLPELQHVAHTNFCDIGFALDNAGRRLILVSCLDNLGKGAAGQAVQNFNLMLGIKEQTALQ